MIKQQSFTLKALQLTSVALALILSSSCILVDESESGSSSDSSSPFSFSSSWSTLDQYSLDSLANSRANAVAFTSSGDILMAGSAEHTTTNFHWITRKSSGGSVTTVDDYQLSVGKNASASDIIINASGLAYVAGYALDSNGLSRWIVRRESSPGVWETTDNFQLAANSPSVAKSIAISSDNNIYVVGSATSGGKQHWIVRKYTHATGLWSTMDDQASAGAADMIATDVTVNAAGSQIAVVGYSLSAAGDAAIARMYNGSWNNLNTGFQVTAGKGTYYRSALYLSDGSLLISGNAIDNSDKSHWLIRKVSSGTPTAAPSTVDSYQYEAGQNSYADAIAYSSSDNKVYVVGRGLNSSAQTAWIVRSSSDDGDNFNAEAETEPQSGLEYAAFGVAISSDNQVAVCGMFVDTITTWLAYILE